MSAQEEDGVGAVRRLVKSKSGLKIVCQHDREAAPWDMAEPAWTPDKEVLLLINLYKNKRLQAKKMYGYLQSDLKIMTSFFGILKVSEWFIQLINSSLGTSSVF